MRNLIKNQRTIYYLNFLNYENVVDSQGNLTGEKRIVYAPKRKLNTNISGARGSSQIEAFGTDIRYDKSFVLTAKEFANTKITENTVFFVDTKPTYNSDGIPLYDYIVERIADSINEVVIAITKVRR